MNPSTPRTALCSSSRAAPREVPAPAIQIFKFDALRRPTETGSGSDADKTYRALFRQAFDTADRLQWRASALGMLEQNRYDSEGQLLESGRYSNTMARTVRYAYDSQGRLSTFENNQGRRLQLRYDTAGLAQSATDSLGRTVDFSATADQPTETGVLPTRVYADDFGRHRQLQPGHRVHPPNIRCRQSADCHARCARPARRLRLRPRRAHRSANALIAHGNRTHRDPDGTMPDGASLPSITRRRASVTSTTPVACASPASSPPINRMARNHIASRAITTTQRVPCAQSACRTAAR